MSERRIAPNLGSVDPADPPFTYSQQFHIPTTLVLSGGRGGWTVGWGSQGVISHYSPSLSRTVHPLYWTVCLSLTRLVVISWQQLPKAAGLS